MSFLSPLLFRKSAVTAIQSHHHQSVGNRLLMKAQQRGLLLFPVRQQECPAVAAAAVRWLSSSQGEKAGGEEAGGTSSNTTLIKGDGNHDDDDSSLIVSQFKNQIVHQLWTDRARAKKEVGTIKPLGGQDSCPSLAEQHGKTPCQSETSVQYPFTSDELLAESYRSPWNTMRLGKLFEDLDALAGNIAFYHVRNESEDSNVVHPLIVTASVDRIRLTRERTSTLQMDQILSGRVTFVGTSSMEIKMTCTGSQDNNEPWLEAFFTFVTLDPNTKKPIHITPLLPQNEQEQTEFDAGAKRASIKKERRKQQQQQKGSSSSADKVQQQAQELLELARPTLLLNMPPRSPTAGSSTMIQMKETQLQNAMIAQPQVRNLHNRIFGGFLMRRAFELAFSNAYVFGGSRPIFQEVDEVSFKAPVDVGDLLVFNSRVLYTTPASGNNKYPLVHVEVEAWVTIPEQADAKLSNQFYFTFAIVGDDDDDNDDVDSSGSNANSAPMIQQLRQILPANIDEATRMARRMEADRQQAEE